MDGIDENMQSELVELFIGETTKYLDSLLTLLSAGSYDRVSIIAHTLKSSSGQFNIKAVVHDLERIEKHQKFGVSEVEVVFLVNKVVVLLNRAMQEMAEDFNLKYPID
jgi:HPt (histidine-containing phosphotransfer) domain-containing protein